MPEETREFRKMMREEVARAEEAAEFAIYLNHDTEPELACAMTIVLGEISHTPLYYSVGGKIGPRPRNPVNLQYACADMLIMGQTDRAKRYLQRAVRIRTTHGMYVGEEQTILDNFDRVQAIISSSKDDLTRMREKYGHPPFKEFLV